MGRQQRLALADEHGGRKFGEEHTGFTIEAQLIRNIQESEWEWRVHYYDPTSDSYLGVFLDAHGGYLYNTTTFEGNYFKIEKSVSESRDFYLPFVVLLTIVLIPLGVLIVLILGHRKAKEN